MARTVNVEKIRAYIREMRNLSGVRAILGTAEARQTHLISISRHKKKTEVFEKFSHFKKGDTIYIGNKKAALESSWWKDGWARPLKIVKVFPRKKEWHVAYGGKTVLLTPAMAQMLKMSHESNAEALTDALRLDRKTGSHNIIESFIKDQYR